MRQIVLDTETTGLEAGDHRIIEIGAIELMSRRVTSSRFHYYLNPERTVEAGAIEIHGLDNEFLADKPRFADIAEELTEYLGDAELIIHNAPFDLAFLNAEYRLLDPAAEPLEDRLPVIDTLAEARRLHPGQQNSLDALCRRYGVDNSARDLHGALLDAHLLAEVYLAMTGGQTAMQLDVNAAAGGDTEQTVADLLARLGRPAVLRPSEAEIEAHRSRLAAIREAAEKELVWAEDLKG